MGASLWLLPPADSKVGHELYKLINETLPSLLPNVQLPHFPPHITLTSDVDPTLDPSTVTSSIEVKESPNVKFAKVDVGKTFFTRVTLHLEKVDSIKNLAVECRQRYVTKGNWEEAEKWGEESFVPHLSLIYMEDIPEAETVKKIEEEVKKAGIKLDAEAWKGGQIALVNCTKPIEEWKVEGVRDL